MVDPHSITHNESLATFRLAFIRRVGVGKSKVSYSDLQDATGIAVRTLKSYTEGQSMPQLENILKLIAYFEPAFASELLSGTGKGGVDYVDRADEVDALAAAADLSRHVSELAERSQDGKFCHSDRAVMGPKLIGLASRIEEQGKAMMYEVPR